MDLINPLTKEWMDAYVHNPSTAILIDANNDMQTGLLLAEQLHKQLVADITSPLLLVEPTKTKSIGIDDIRELQRTLSLKANTSNAISRMAVIMYADKLTPEAQNALLKLIEELPDGTSICLVADSRDSLLPTIRSRCFTIPLLPFESSQARLHATKYTTDSQEVERALLMSDGNLTDFMAHIKGQENESVTFAKQFLQASVYDRQVLLIKLQKSKNFDATDFLHAIALISKVAMRKTNSAKMKQQWKSRLKTTLESQDMLARNVMSKLVLLRLSVML